MRCSQGSRRPRRLAKIVRYPRRLEANQRKKKIGNQPESPCKLPPLSFPPSLAPPGSSVAAAADPEGAMTEIDLREQQQEGGKEWKAGCARASKSSARDWGREMRRCCTCVRGERASMSLWWRDLRRGMYGRAFVDFLVGLAIISLSVCSFLVFSFSFFFPPSCCYFPIS